MLSLKPYILLTLLCSILYLAGIATVPIVDRDAPHFAQATRQILESGNYFQIKFQNKNRHLKPPGIYWLQAASVKLFSNTESTKVWPYRLSSALGGWLAVLLTFFFTRKIYSESNDDDSEDSSLASKKDKQHKAEKTALLAAGLLASSLLLIIESHLVVTDAVLLLTMVCMQGALWLIYVRYRNNQRVGWQWPLIFWLAMAAGFLIKGITPLVGLLTIFTLAVFDYRIADYRLSDKNLANKKLADKKFEIFKKTKFIWGVALFILCAAWLIPVSLTSHSNFLWDMVHGDVIPKLVGGQESHGMPSGYFLVLFTLMFWPGALFIWHGNMWGWNHRRNPIERFLLAWIIPTWIFFALVPTKLPQYILPVYPAIAILIARALIDAKHNRWFKIPALLNKLQYFSWTLFGLGIASSFILIPLYLEGRILIAGVAAAILMILIVIGSVVNLYYENYLRAATINIVGFGCVMVLIFQWMLPNLQSLWISEKIATILHHNTFYQQNSTKPLLSVGYGEPSLVFLMGTKGVLFSSSQNALNLLKAEKSNFVVVSGLEKKAFLSLAQEDKVALKPLATVKGYNYSNGRWMTLTILQGIIA